MKNLANLTRDQVPNGSRVLVSREGRDEIRKGRIQSYGPTQAYINFNDGSHCSIPIGDVMLLGKEDGTRVGFYDDTESKHCRGFADSDFEDEKLPHETFVWFDDGREDFVITKNITPFAKMGIYAWGKCVPRNIAAEAYEKPENYVNIAYWNGNNRLQQWIKDLWIMKNCPDCTANTPVIARLMMLELTRSDLRQLENDMSKYRLEPCFSRIFKDEDDENHDRFGQMNNHFIQAARNAIENHRVFYCGCW